MSKSKKRQKMSAQKRARLAKVIKAGGKSKYAQKHERASRGTFSPTSPFYMPPAAEAK